MQTWDGPLRKAARTKTGRGFSRNSHVYSSEYIQVRGLTEVAFLVQLTSQK
jgi:hypothetical protein